MHLIHDKTLDALDEQDLLTLVENQVPEGKFIEYKSKLPGKSNTDKKEFLADVSSFSNAAGGHIIFGILEKKGLPSKLTGLGDIDPDSEVLRLENLLRDAIAPRMPGISIRAIPLKTLGYAIVLRIPKSWISPHMVTYAGSSKFFSRNSAGKYQLDVHELRVVFAAANFESNRTREFHTDRLGIIVAGETPIMLKRGPRIVLHIIPLGVFESRKRYDLTDFQLSKNREYLAPIDATHGNNFRFNFDGILTYESSGSTSSASSYLQVFRNGIIESVCTSLFSYRDNFRLIPSVVFEQELVKALGRFLVLLKKMEIDPPIFVMLSLLGISGFAMASTSKGSFYGTEYNMIDRNDLIIPEILVEDIAQSPDQILRPAFDAVWNSAGQPNSPHYDADGNWNLMES